MAEQTQSFPGAFCESCNKWRKPSAMLPDGSCPRCGTQLEDTSVYADGSPLDEEAAQAARIKIPWHFWVMVGATALYLGWRVIQGLQSLF